MNPDFLDIIRALLDAEARFIIVGAYAVNIYVEPRATGDLDILVEVHDVKHLNDMIKGLQAKPLVSAVRRVEG